MFTTPLRSEYIPPIPANTSGVEKTSIDAISDAVKTLLRFSLPERVARIPSPIPSAERTTAPQPSRRRPRIAVHTPSAAPTTPTRIGQRIVRASIGGRERDPPRPRRGAARARRLRGGGRAGGEPPCSAARR